MKKIFFASIMLVAAYAINAQQTTVTYQATSSNAPMDITTHFSATHPGVTVTSWQSSGDYWYGSYKNENNRLVYVYYSTQPWYMYDMTRNEGFIVALPVLNTFVPEAVVTSAINSYGNDLYSITAMKPGTPGTEGSYVVTIVKNGVSDRVMMNGEGVVVNRQM